MHGLAFNVLSIGSIANMGLILIFDDKKCLIYQGPEKTIGQWIHGWTIGFDQYIIISPKFKICAIASPLTSSP